MVSPEAETGGNKREKLIIFCILFVFIVVFVSLGVSFIKLDTGPKFTDCQYFRAVDYYRYFFAGQKTGLFSFSFRELAYPPLTFLVSQFFFLAGGVSMETARISILFFAAIFIIASFGTGYELGGIPGGITAAAIAASSPFIVEFSRLYFLDFPQTAMTALAFWILLKTRFFSDRKYSVLFGTALSLAFLTKWSSAFYLWFPILFFAAGAFLKDKYPLIFKLSAFIPVVAVCSFIGVFYANAGSPANRGWGWLGAYLLFVVLFSYGAFGYFSGKQKKMAQNQDLSGKETGNVINGLYSFLVFAVLTAPWYLWASQRIREKFLDDMNLHNTLKMTPDYLRTFFGEMFAVSPVFLLLVLLGIIAVFAVRGDKFTTKLMIALWLPVQILFIMKYGFPEPRYLLTFIFIGAVIASVSVSLFGKAAWAVSGVLAVGGLVIIAGWTFFPPFGHHDFNRANPVRPGWLPGITINASREPDRNTVDIKPLADILEPEIRHNENFRISIVDLPGDTGNAYNLVEYIQEDLFLKRKLRPIISNVFVGGFKNSSSPILNQNAQGDVFIVFHSESGFSKSDAESVAARLGIPSFGTDIVKLGDDYFATVIFRR